MLLRFCSSSYSEKNCNERPYCQFADDRCSIVSDNQDIVNNLQTVCDKETIWSKILAIGVAIAFIIGKVCYSLVHTISYYMYKTRYFFQPQKKTSKSYNLYVTHLVLQSSQ